jgi:hypothetical protein
MFFEKLIDIRVIEIVFSTIPLHKLDHCCHLPSLLVGRTGCRLLQHLQYVRLEKLDNLYCNFKKFKYSWKLPIFSSLDSHNIASFYSIVTNLLDLLIFVNILTNCLPAIIFMHVMVSFSLQISTVLKCS